MLPTQQSASPTPLATSTETNTISGAHVDTNAGAQCHYHADHFSYLDYRTYRDTCSAIPLIMIKLNIQAQMRLDIRFFITS